MVQLKKYDKIRKKLKASLDKLNEEEIYSLYQEGAIDLAANGFSDEEIEEVKELVTIRQNAIDILEYLESIEV